MSCQFCIFFVSLPHKTKLFFDYFKMRLYKPYGPEKGGNFRYRYPHQFSNLVPFSQLS